MSQGGALQTATDRKAGSFRRNILWGMVLAVLAGGAAGGLWWAGESARESHLLTQARQSEVRSQSEALLNSFWTSVDSIRVRAVNHLKQAIATSGQQLEIEDDVILHWAEATISSDGTRIEAFPRVAVNLRFGGSDEDTPEFEGAYLKTLAEKFNLAEARKKGVSVLRLRRDPQRSQEWLAFGFPLAPPRNAVIFALVDPVLAFPFLKRVSESMRAYLVADDGQVLAHTLSSYVGASFKTSRVFAEIQRKNASAPVPAIDQLPVLAHAARPGSFPFQIVVEKVIPAIASSEGFTGLLFWVAWACAAALLIGPFIVMWALRRRRRGLDALEPELASLGLPEAPSFDETPTWVAEADSHAETKVPEEAHEEASEHLTAELAGPAEEPPPSVSRAIDELRATQQALRLAREEMNLIAQFEMDAPRMRDPMAVARRMAEMTAQFCDSPTLYFTYHDELRNAVLQASGGFGPMEVPLTFSFPVSDELLDEIAGAEQSGQMASLADHEPLAKLILGKFGVAHFEAWAVTGFGFYGRLTGKPRLLGVLVILQAGVDSAKRRESISRILRTTGLVYENAILST